MGGPIVNVNDFMDPAIDGASINGVNVSVSGTPDLGIIELTGPIDQILIGGQEVLFDEVRYVPEPSTLAVALIGFALMCVNRRCRGLPQYSSK